MNEFKNKVAVITGGSRGIGSVIAIKLAKLGVKVCISYFRNHKAAEVTVKTIQESGGKVILIQANLNEVDEIKSLFEKVRVHSNNIDYFIHCAALGNLKPLSEITSSAWDITMNVNARAFLLCSKFAKQLMINSPGTIVAVSSMGSQRFIPSYGAIGVSKAALEATVRYLAAEYAQLGIRVNAVTGGPIESETLQKFINFDSLKQSCVNLTPSNRLGTAEDLADVVIFLCSELSRWIVGQTIIADGGMSLSYGYYRTPDASS